MTRETTAERDAREARAVRALFDDAAAEVPEHSVVVMADAPGPLPWFRPRCRCGWSGRGRRAVAAAGVLHVKRLCELEGAAHAARPEGVTGGERGL